MRKMEAVTAVGAAASIAAATAAAAAVVAAAADIVGYLNGPAPDTVGGGLPGLLVLIPPASA